MLKVIDSSFLQFCLNDKKAQKYLLGGFECLVKLYQSQLLPRVAVILKDLYDADLLEEDVILAWAEKVCISQFYIQLRLIEHLIRSSSLNYELWLIFLCFKVSKKYVSKELAKEIHAKAAPFVKWLKEAEEESEGSEAEEEDDDENVEVISSPIHLFLPVWNFWISSIYLWADWTKVPLSSYSCIILSLSLEELVVSQALAISQECSVAVLLTLEPMEACFHHGKKRNLSCSAIYI